MAIKTETKYGQRSLIIVSSVVIILVGLWFLFSKDWPLFRDFLKMREEIYQKKSGCLKNLGEYDKRYEATR